ncbi:E3 ubiquitin-protein ligase huwe1 [Bulinus truncatus]|nr:E3 ubiquitin-protein ligase huwe1 [Bulinus truncatus]
MKVDRSKLKKSSSEVPADCKVLIDKLKSLSADDLYKELKDIKSWTYGKCELYHWADILDVFDGILEKSCAKENDKKWTLYCDLPGSEQSWGGKENGFGLAECCQDLPAGNFPSSATTLHFEFYIEAKEDKCNKRFSHGSATVIQSIHMENVDRTGKMPSQIMEDILDAYDVPQDKQARLQAISILVYSSAIQDNMNVILYPGLIEELVDIVEIKDSALVDIKSAALRTLTSVIHIERNPRSHMEFGLAASILSTFPNHFTHVCNTISMSVISCLLHNIHVSYHMSVTQSPCQLSHVCYTFSMSVISCLLHNLHVSYLMSAIYSPNNLIPRLPYHSCHVFRITPATPPYHSCHVHCITPAKSTVSLLPLFRIIPATSTVSLLSRLPYHSFHVFRITPATSTVSLLSRLPYHSFHVFRITPATSTVSLLPPFRIIPATSTVSLLPSFRITPATSTVSLLPLFCIIPATSTVSLLSRSLYHSCQVFRITPATPPYHSCHVHCITPVTSSVSLLSRLLYHACHVFLITPVTSTL